MMFDSMQLGLCVFLGEFFGVAARPVSIDKASGRYLHQCPHEEGVVGADPHVAGVRGSFPGVEVVRAACHERVSHPAHLNPLVLA